MSRIGLHRHSSGPGNDDDPLDGLVNLFDLGLVLAVAFLVAGLTIGGVTSTTAAPTTPSERRAGEREVTLPTTPRRAEGDGEAVGTVYRLPDGTLVLAGDGAPPSTP